MASRYIRAQALTLTKAHEERAGPLNGIAASVKKYGFDDPLIVYSDDPTKVTTNASCSADDLTILLQDKQLVYNAFPSLSKNLTPIAAAYGLQPLEIPDSVKVHYLSAPDLVEAALSPLLELLDPVDSSLCISIDAEWNISRTIGVSILQIAPHSDPNSIFIIPVRGMTSTSNTHSLKTCGRCTAFVFFPLHYFVFLSATGFSKSALL